jgi:hypothetical protein
MARQSKAKVKASQDEATRDKARKDKEMLSMAGHDEKR